MEYVLIYFLYYFLGSVYALSFGLIIMCSIHIGYSICGMILFTKLVMYKKHKVSTITDERIG